MDRDFERISEKLDEGKYQESLRFHEEFSTNENYVMEKIPENIGCFNRNKWIQDKVALLGSKKALVFVEKSKMMLAFLENDEKYWMPAEKAQFYLYAFNDSGSSSLIIEQTNNGYCYYGVVDKFLVVYTKNYDEAVDHLKQYNDGRSIVMLGVGSSFEHSCNKTLSHKDVINSVYEANASKNLSNNIDEINDDLIYLNEDHDQNCFGSTNKDDCAEHTIDEAFLHWFYNIKNQPGYKRKYLLRALFTGIILFSIADIFCAYNSAQIKKEIEVTMQKLNKIEHR